MNNINTNTQSHCNVNYHIYNSKDAAALFNNRDIYIWGAGLKGKGFRLALERNGFKIKAFIDSYPALIGTEYQGIPILDPNSILNNPTILKNSFILMASVGIKNSEMFIACQNVGLVKGKDFIDIQELSPYYPTVEVVGACNLKCISCPRSNSLNPPKKGGMLSAADYTKIIEKLIKEIPFLYLVDLYIWGEPLLNPELAEIVKINTKYNIASGISTNLNAGKYLEEVVKAAPEQIRVSVSGFGKDNYEVSHAGGNWDKLYKNLLLLSEYIKKYETKTIVEVYYHLNKQNQSEYKIMAELCVELGYRIHPAISMIFPDYVIDYVEGKQLCQEAIKGKELMLVDVDDMLKAAKRDHDKSCLLKRILPVINWDMSVLSCCNYLYDKLADNYLEISIDDIIELRNSSALCQKCQNHSLHRYFNPLMYSEFINELVNN